MGHKRFMMALVLLFSASIITGCGGGSGSSTPALGSGENNSPGVSLPSGGGDGSVSLAWNAPVTNEDGTALSDLAGYRVHIGTSPRSYSDSVEVGNVTSCSVGGLSPGTYYVTVTAYNTSGAESGYSNEVTKTVP